LGGGAPLWPDAPGGESLRGVRRVQ
jgi:hypothetical protein